MALPDTVSQSEGAPRTISYTRMSAFGTKRTSDVALHMSAFGGKADIVRTCRHAAFDPGRHLNRADRYLCF